jgi:hypothetical protein
VLPTLVAGLLSGAIARDPSLGSVCARCRCGRVLVAERDDFTIIVGTSIRGTVKTWRPFGAAQARASPY